MKKTSFKIKKFLAVVYWITVYGFAMIGFVFVGVFFAIKLKLTNVNGSVDEMTEVFQSRADELENITNGLASETNDSGDLENITAKIDQLTTEKRLKVENLCSLEELSYTAPKNVEKILTIRKQNVSDTTISQMIFAVKTYLTDRESFDSNVANCFNNFENKKIDEEEILNRVKTTNGSNIFVWPDEDEWKTVTASVIKDRDGIKRAAETVDIDPRLIVSDLIVEQLRVYFSARELYQKYFEPLKILSNMNKMSLGVMGIKEATAIQIENHLKDKNSPYYLGEKYENLLDYPANQNINKERYSRLTDEKHYYSYLYAAIYLKQMITQWKNAGFDISNRPEIIGTLFNVGFPQSKPNPNPKVGGSTVNIGQNKYSFGRLSYEFFYSGELAEAFPYIN